MCHHGNNNRPITGAKEGGVIDGMQQHMVMLTNHLVLLWYSQPPTHNASVTSQTMHTNLLKSLVTYYQIHRSSNGDKNSDLFTMW